MAKRLLAALLLLSLFPLSRPLQATTVVPPSDLGQLAKASGTVTFARAVESWVEPGVTIPHTVTRFQRLQGTVGDAAGRRLRRAAGLVVHR